MGGKTSKKVDNNEKSVAMVYDNNEENGDERNVAWSFEGK